MRATLALLSLSLGVAPASAQSLYKCVDDQRRVTYSSAACDKQGLRDAGPIAERTTSMPFTAPPAAGKPAADGPPPTVKLKPPPDDKPAR